MTDVFIVDTKKTLDLGDLGKPNSMSITNSKIIVFGGPYSNLQATKKMKSIAESMGILPSNIVCSGDIVAYCAQPQETVKLIRDWGISVVMGNCEAALAYQTPDCGCGFSHESTCAILSNDWYAFARKKVNNKSCQWMSSLPHVIHFSLLGYSFYCVHGSIYKLNQFVFASDDKAEKERQLALSDSDVIIGGHCGLPFGQVLDSGAWLNSGVVGMPANDGTPRGWYMLIEGRAHKDVCISWHSVNYDVEEVQHKMCEENLPKDYHNALASGLWPSLDILPITERGQTGKSLSLPPLHLRG